MGTSNLSGKDWWHANQSRYPNSREIGDLEPGFRSNVERFVASLRQAGATVVVSSTRRNAIRAYLMHYSWKIVNGKIDPREVPKRNGLSIEWDHGNIQESRRAAEEMVNLFGMAHIASLTSNHIKGKAIDMTISWKDVLVVTQPAPLFAKIESSPRTGQNRKLHELGATVFDVRKLVSDPPHWSYNGR
jgi:hypothetical protein